MDTELLNRTARRVIGTGTTIRRNALHILADTLTATNHYILKAANILDWTLMATGTTAKASAEEVMRVHHEKVKIRTTYPKNNAYGPAIYFDTQVPAIQWRKPL